MNLLQGRLSAAAAYSLACPCWGHVKTTGVSCGILQDDESLQKEAKRKRKKTKKNKKERKESKEEEGEYVKKI